MDLPPLLHRRRNTHRKRISISRLSSDTTTTLPEYSSPRHLHTPWSRSAPNLSELDFDKPPDYEADEETDDPEYSSPPPLPSRRQRPSNPPRRRSHHSVDLASSSSSDPYLDSLLARSVHALEMSNTLLQSSISTQSSLSAVLAADSMADQSLEARARGLTSRIRGNRDMHEGWMDDLDEITKRVESLFGDQPRNGKRPIPPAETDTISQSLPTGTHMPVQRYRRRPSLELRRTDPQLHLVNTDSVPVIPPPRALTQYVSVESSVGDAAESTSDPYSILLPSTIGLRAGSHVSNFSPVWGPSNSQVSSPIPTGRSSEPPTPAYNLLSSLKTRPTSSRSSSSRSSSAVPSPRASQPSFMDVVRSGNSASASRSSSRTSTYSSPDRTISRRSSSSRSRSVTPSRRGSSPLPPPRPMTPTIEESTPSSSDSSDDGPRAVQTIESLKKILEDLPPPTVASDPKGKQPADSRPRAPAFLPRSPAPMPWAETSTATASVSRLFTKGRHHSSTRPPSPPKHSSLKGGSRPTSMVLPPTNSGEGTNGNENAVAGPSTGASAFAVGAGLVASMLGTGTGSSSRTSSGHSTPRRITFAQLPESYTQSRGGEGTPSRLRDKKRKKAKAAKDKREREKEGVGDGSWWSSWLVGGMGTGPSGLGGIGSAEERAEEKFARGWGPRSGSVGGLEDWAV